MRLSAILAVAGGLSQVNAWGEVGHRTVAYVASKYLTPATLSYLNGILAYTDGKDISDGAIWPDQIKHGRPATAPWHYIDARDSPPKTCGIHYPSDCGDKASDGCIITAMANYTALFMDPSTDDETRQEALKFVLHFVGDIHQPLHVEDAYRGGNEIHVCFRKSCSKNNLHAVWDEDIIHKLVDIPLAAKEEQKIEAAQNWATKLVGGETDRVAALKAECSDVSQPNTCTLAWAKESNAWVCKYVMKQSIEWLESNDLSLDYYDGAVPIVEKQVTTAGIRLAAWLEAMVAGSQSLASGGNGQKVLGNMEF